MNVPNNWLDIFQSTVTSPAFWLIFAIIAVLTALRCSVQQRSKLVSLFKGHSGQVTITQTALKELIKKTTIDEVHPASTPKVSLYLKNNKCNIEVRLKLFSSQRVGPISESLQEKIDEVLKSCLSIEKVGNINIIVTGFVADRKARESEAEA